METMTTNRKRYVAPVVTRHGGATEKTRGNCTCKTEPCDFKPAPADDVIEQ